MDMDHWLRMLPYSSINRPELESDMSFSAFKQSVDIPDSYNQVPLIGSDPMIKYLNQILLEESIDDANNHDAICDPIALRATEDSLYEALLEKPLSHFDTSIGSCTYDVTDFPPGKLFVANDSPHLSIQTSSCQSTSDDPRRSSYNIDNPMISRMDAYLCGADSVPNGFGDLEAASILNFKRGVEEARKFLPPVNRLVIDFDEYSMLPLTEELNQGVVNIEREYSADSPRQRRKHYCPNESVLEEERSRKHSAVLDEDNDSPSRASCTQQKRRSGQKSHSKKQGEVVNLEALLTYCANSVVDADYSCAVDALKKIRQYSSPTGNASQRLAHAFVDSLEARLRGSGTQLYVPPFCNTVITSGLTKSHFSSYVPYMSFIFNFSNRMIYETASRGSSLHVIDFGILHGTQWPTLIRDLSRRPGGPPRLRITGIELPQAGFHPSQMIVETGLHLAKYCERFGVPFEYNAIAAQHWETIKIDDLKLASGEVITVNCVYRFKHLLDEAAFGEHSPRDAVLNLIRKVNPHIFVHTVHSASHGSPFFLTRFRDALNLYSVFFDSLDTLFPRDDYHRLNFEQAFMGREIRNIIACEGMERVERPETYKQCQSRTMRAGFEPMPLNSQVVGKLIGKARASYHKDFLFGEDGHWILQGIKGRIVSASSCWVAAQQSHNKR